ncbi:MAG: hypothetical protein D6759_05175 [Chloroflexi bacterium]|nr:MAG: hypothetical protein D6759_05175 [Chloroflexota bacterium]
MSITDRAQPDPIADIKLPNGYMLWAIQAMEEAIGSDGVAEVLRHAGLERLIGSPPPSDMELGSLTFRDFTNFGVAVLELHGRAGKGLVQRMGRYAARRTIEDLPGIFNLASAALKMLPTNKQLHAALLQMANGFREIYNKAGIELHLTIEEQDDKFIYQAVECPSCAGKQASEPMCALWVGAFEEGASWVTGGKKFQIREVACRALGAPACVWEIGKTPVG